MKTTFHLGVGVMVLMVVFARSSPAAEAGNGRPAWESYGVLAERNIFSRERRSVVARQEPDAVPLPPPPERFVVLTGIAGRGDRYVAFLENIRTGATIAARDGDALLEGRIKSVTLDMIEYQKDDHVEVVGIGGTLEGGKAGATGSALSPSGTSATDQAPVAGSAEAEILERLRQKREKELQR